MKIEFYKPHKTSLPQQVVKGTPFRESSTEFRFKWQADEMEMGITHGVYMAMSSSGLFRMYIAAPGSTSAYYESADLSCKPVEAELDPYMLRSSLKLNVGTTMMFLGKFKTSLLYPLVEHIADNYSVDIDRRMVVPKVKREEVHNLDDT